MTSKTIIVTQNTHITILISKSESWSTTDHQDNLNSTITLIHGGPQQKDQLSITDLQKDVSATQINCLRIGKTRSRMKLQATTHLRLWESNMLLFLVHSELKWSVFANADRRTFEATPSLLVVLSQRKRRLLSSLSYSYSQLNTNHDPTYFIAIDSSNSLMRIRP